MSLVRTCSKCRLEKNANEFYVKNSLTGRLHAQCKACYKELRKLSHAEHYKRYGEAYRLRARIRRAKVKKNLQVKLLGYMRDKSCEMCGEDDLRVLEFDHLDPSTKSFGISWAVCSGYKWETIMVEITKCRILCANCHKRHTALQQGWFKAIQQ